MVETSYINEPAIFSEVIFNLKSLGLRPVLAHPERYTYMYSDFKRYREIYEKGILFQINTVSLSGYYSPAAKHVAEKLIQEGMVDFIGTDCHAIRHIDALKKTMRLKSYKMLSPLPLLNNSL